MQCEHRTIALGKSSLVIRVRPIARTKNEVVAITATGVTIKEIQGEITEELLEAIDADPSKIPLKDIRRVSRTCAGTFSASSLWTLYTVETPRGNSEFQVRERETATVNSTLGRLLQDRLDPEMARSASATERFLYGVGFCAISLVIFVAYVCIVIGAVSGDLRFLGFGITGLVAVGAACFFGQQKSARSRAPEPVKPRKPVKPRSYGRSGRKPFRSKSLGWFLKLLGLIWIIAIFWSNNLDAFIAKLFGKNPQIAGQVWWAMYAPGFGLLYYGYRMCLRTFEPHRHSDPRPPVVYLRAFDDDGRGTFQPTSLLAKVHGIESIWGGDEAGFFRKRVEVPFWFAHPVKLLRMFLNADRHSAEESLAAAFRGCGPFVALGQPGERLATPGADRMYVPHDNWQRVVLEYLDRCQTVVLQPSKTQGIRWEVNQVFQRVARHRVLLSMIDFHERSDDYQEFRAWLEEQNGVKLPLSVPFLGEPCFVYFETDGTPRIQRLCFLSPLVWSLTCNAVDTYRTFYTFIQGLSGAPRDLPRRPSKRSLHAAASLLVPTVCVLGVIFFGFIQYFGEVGVDIASDNLTRFVNTLPLVTSEDTPPKVWQGKRIGYEFRLGKDWVRGTASPESSNNEYSFKYRGSIGIFTVNVLDTELGGERQTSEFVVKAVEELRSKAIGHSVNVTLTSSKVVKTTDASWIELKLNRDYGAGIREGQRIRVYQSMGQTLMASVVMPLFTHYDRISDDALATLKIIETPEDRLLREARDGKPIEYRGRGMRYTLSLPPIWRATDVDKETVKGVIAVAKQTGTPLVMPEHVFSLRDEKLATLTIEFSEEELDLDLLDQIADGHVQFGKKFAAATSPGADLTVRVVDRRKVRSGEREWGHLEFRIETPSNQKGHNELLRMSSYKGNTLVLGVNIYNDCPAVRRLVTEALDTARILPSPLPAGYEESWAGKTVFLSRPKITYKMPAEGGKSAERGILRSPVYVVLDDNDGKLSVKEEGRKALFDKDDAVLEEKAVDFFTDYLRANPNNLEALFNRAIAWSQNGKPDNALRDFTEVIRRDPKNSGAFYNRGMILRSQKEYEAAIRDFADSARLDPKKADALDAEARLLATCPEEKFRDGRKAVEQATRSCELDIWQDPEHLATLAAAYAEAGEFPNAVKWQEKALQDKDYASKFKAEARTRLELYKNSKAFHEE